MAAMAVSTLAAAVMTITSRRGSSLARFAQQLHAVHVRHHQVGDQHGKRAFGLEQFQRLEWIRRAFDGISLPLQMTGHHVQQALRRRQPPEFFQDSITIALSKLPMSGWCFGSRMVNVVPCPTTLSTSMRP